LGITSLHAGDVRINLPKKSKYTPVQKLNRDGVTAVEKHQYDKAKKLFYEAYLIDPNDPFTLNNLGYLSELEGDAERAQRFYQLASEQSSDAVIDKATNELVQGKPVSTVAGNAEEKSIRVNRMNNEAIVLLTKDRAPEADLVLQKALTIDPRNPFTLNNLGFTKEKEGELEAAYQLYTAAANVNSQERIQVTADNNWRGRRISEVASESAKKLNKRIRGGDSVESRVAILNLRGVSAMNRNDRRAARDFIKQAYKLDPADAFTLNNMGFLAEMDGDRETADYYYLRAAEANRNGARITLATRKEVEGKRIGEVAVNTDSLILTRMDAERAARQSIGGPVVLRKRDNSAVVEPATPVAPPTQVRVSDANGDLILPPRPASSGVTSQPVPSSGGKLMMPLPENQQPTTVHEGQNDGGLLMPLPDDEQPANQGQQNPTPVIPPQTPPAPQQQVQPNGGLLLPLPDSQQPPAARSPNQQPQKQTPPPQAQPDNNNRGVYSPPPAGRVAAPSSQPPRKINDTAPNQKKPAPPSTSSTPNTSGPKKISDQD
jgi:Flp pilus assembly protein TadD